MSMNNFMKVWRAIEKIAIGIAGSVLGGVLAKKLIDASEER